MSIVLYTTIFGDSDSLKPSPAGVEAVCFVDRVADYPAGHGWTLKPWTVTGDPRREAWRLRCVAHELFPEAETTIWVDASFTVTNAPLLLRHSAGADLAALRHHTRTSCYEEGREIVRVKQAPKAIVERQLSAYRRAQFNPAHLSISCILVRTNKPAVRRFNQSWWQQIESHPGDNTQLSLDYSAWRQGVRIQALAGTRHKNPYAVHDHADHKRRRRPYTSAETVATL